MSPPQIWAIIWGGFLAAALLWGAFSLAAALLDRPMRAWRWRRAQARQRRLVHPCRCPYVPGPHSHYRRSL